MRAMKCLAWGLTVTYAANSLAAPLDTEVCNNLKEEHGQLTAAGAKANMERGPEWAKAHLAPDRMQQIGRLIEVEEQLAFRCPQAKPPLEGVENQKTTGAAPGAPGGGDQPQRLGRPKVPKTLSATRTGGQNEPRRLKKPPPRPTANDAYVVPPKANDVYMLAPRAPSAMPSRAPAQ